MGYVKYTVPVAHPDFGRMKLCPNTDWHSSDIETRLLAASGLLEDERWTVEDLEAVNGNGLAMLMKTWLEDPRGWVYLWGDYGTGKTVALQAAVREFCARGKPAYYTTFADLLTFMQSTFGASRDRGDETFDSRLNRLRHIPLLAIDEFDAEKYKASEWSEQLRGQLLDFRYRNALADTPANRTFMLLAGNEDPARLPEYLRERVHDKRFIVFHYEGPSLRQSASWWDD